MCPKSQASRIQHLARHRQSWVKVNCQVDEQIAALVAALNKIPELQTVESCQGYGGLDGQGYLYFCYGDWRRICSLVFTTLGPELSKAFGGNVRVSVEMCDSRKPLGMIEFDSALAPKVASIVKKIAAPLCRPGYGRLRRLETARHPRQRAI